MSMVPFVSTARAMLTINEDDETYMGMQLSCKECKDFNPCKTQFSFRTMRVINYFPWSTSTLNWIIVGVVSDILSDQETSGKAKHHIFCCYVQPALKMTLP